VLMIYTLYRLTPGRTFTLNNRWHKDVFPKHCFFFIRKNSKDLWEWVRFLCETKHRSYLYCHTVKADIRGLKDRVLKDYKGSPLFEVVAPVKTTKIINYTKRQKVGLSEAQYELRRRGRT
jgi:hypothetical protein